MSTEIIEQVLALAAKAGAGAELERSAVAQNHRELLERAEASIGAWDAVLAKALVQACKGRKTRARRQAAEPVIPESTHERTVEDGWDGLVFVVGTDRTVFHMLGDAFVTEHRLPATPEAFEPRGIPQHVEAVLANPNEDVLVAVSNSGTIHSFDSRIVPHSEGHTLRSADVIGISSAEHITAVMLRRRMRRGRFVHVTVGGKIKASSVRDFGNTGPDRHGVQALLLGEQDAICAAFGEKDPSSAVFCASLSGNGIHFKSKDVRTMGLKAQGVKAMEVGSDFDAIIGAFNTDGYHETIVLSALGYGKRVSLEEFRVQGRGGQGMILMRPHIDGDEIAALIPITSLDNDILVFTLAGRVTRIAASAIPLLPRAGRGVRVLALPSGDRIGATCTLPGSGPKEP